MARCEVVQLSSTEGLSSKGNLLVLFLFTDQLEVCKKRSKSFKSPNTMNGYHQRSSFKPYKHIRLMPLSAIKRVLDIRETEDCQKVFSLVVKNNEWSKERLFSFAMTEEDADKTAFLKTLSRQLATNACTADSVSQLPKNSRNYIRETKKKMCNMRKVGMKNKKSMTFFAVL